MAKMTIKEIEDRLKIIQDPQDPWLFELEDDSRKGVQTLLARKRKTFEAAEAMAQERERLLFHERVLWKEGYGYVAGVDEVGRGPLAGPVLACALIFEPSVNLLGIRDSKKLTSTQRQEMLEKIEDQAVSVSYGIVSAQEIDRLNIKQASLKAMAEAIRDLNPTADFALVDAEHIPIQVPQKSLIKGDDRSISIAAASILAKEKRDSLMREYSSQYPAYGFDQHAGYGTQQHLQALEEYGPCPIHRKSFAPVKKYL